MNSLAWSFIFRNHGFNIHPRILIIYWIWSLNQEPNVVGHAVGQKIRFRGIILLKSLARTAVKNSIRRCHTGSSLRIYADGKSSFR